MIRVGAVVQARMGSTRLPGKVLMPLGTSTVLGTLIHRLTACKTLDQIMVAAPNGEAHQIHDGVASAASNPGAGVVREVLPSLSDDDVLGRIYYAAIDAGLDYIVRLTADCPLVCPEVVDDLVKQAIKQSWPYLKTGDTFPEGLDVEVCSDRALWSAQHNATTPHDREHVTPWMRRNLDRGADWQLSRDYGACRLSVDYPGDLEVVRGLVNGRLGQDCTLQDILALYDAEPGLWAPNAHVQRNEWKQGAPDDE